MIKYDVRFFRLEEFKCPCCGSLGNPLSGQGQPAQVLVLWLDLFRAAWGAPVRINSGFRCEKHNAEVGGAAKSRHLLGCAADIAPLWAQSLFKAIAKGLPPKQLPNEYNNLRNFERGNFYEGSAD